MAMEFILHIPTELDKANSLGEMWRSFSERFHAYHSKKSSKRPNKSESSFLLFAAQHKLDKIALDLKDKNISLNVTYQVLEVVESLCLPFFLLLFERFRLFTRSQKPSESVAEFAQSLRQQIDLCQFNDSKLKQNILVKTLISGLENEKMREKLLNVRDVSFEDVVQECESSSEAEQVVKLAKPDVVEPQVNLKSKKGRGRKRKTQVDAQPSDVKKLYITPVDNDDHGDADLDDAALFIKKLNTVSQKKRKKSPRSKRTGPKVKKGLKYLKCFACSSEYCELRTFRRHVKTKHSEIKTYNCVHCSVKFETRKECFAHCMGHLDISTSSNSAKAPGKIGEMKISKPEPDMSYICWHCGEPQATLMHYREHCEKHSAAIRVYTCDICQKTNHNICRLIGHLKGHLVPRHKCQICGSGFGKPNLLAAHMQTHVDKPNHQCEICGKGFVTADRLQCHMRTHTGEKRFTCELCGKTFAQKMSFDYHKRWHAGEKPYECDICGRRTICFGDLKKHKRMHSDKRPYVCETCGKSFRFISNLNRHRKGHTGKRLYVCQVCGRTFIYNEGLRDHIKAGRCPGLKIEDGAAGVKAFHRRPRLRNSNNAVGLPVMNVAFNGATPITIAPQPSQQQPDPSAAYITKTILNPVQLSGNLGPGILSTVPVCSPSPSSLASHQQQQEPIQLQVPISTTFVQVSAPPQLGSHEPQQQAINQQNATVTCTLPEYMNDFTTWPQYVIRNSASMAESGDSSQPGTNVVIVPQFY